MLNNDKGFTLIEVLATLLILTLAFSSLLMTTEYAATKAVYNQHYRQALLLATGQMERIRAYRGMSSTGSWVPLTMTSTQLDNRDGYPLTAYLSKRTTTSTDIRINPGAMDDQVYLTIAWSEVAKLKHGMPVYTPPRKIMLREDYYRQTVVTSSGS